MRVRKRDGGLEPVDLNKIVRAVGALRRQGLDGVDPMRVATRTICGLLDGATTRSSTSCRIRTAAALVSEEPNYSRLAARLLATFIDKEVQNQDIYSFSQSIAAGHAPGLIGDDTADAGRQPLPQAQRRHRPPSATGSSSTSACARSTTATCCATPRAGWSSRRRSTSSCASPAACRTTRRRGDRVLPADLVARVPAVDADAVQLRHHPPADVVSCYLLDSPEDNLDAIYDRYNDVARLSKFAGGIGLAFHRVRAAGSLIRGTNGLSNGIVPWLKTLDSSVVGGQPGRQAQGRGVRLPRDVARRHRGVPRAARQHRRRGPPHPQPQPRQLGARPVHGAGREGLDVVAVRPEEGARTSPTFTATSSSGPTSRPRARAATSARCRPASSTAG